MTAMQKDMEVADQAVLQNTDVSFHNDMSPTLWVNNPYIKAATAENTRKAYRSDIRHYEQWGGLLPSRPEIIIDYLQNYADKLNPRTLARRLVAIKNWHTYQNLPDPTSHPLVSKTMAGIMRVHGKPKDKALALSPEDLIKMIDVLKENESLTQTRDCAILQMGYFGALRRSEIIRIHYEHIQWKPEGLEILLPHSKTDPSHEGQYCVIPFGNETLCPVNALEKWLTASGIQEGPVFRRIFKNNVLGKKPLTPLSINHIVQRTAQLAKIPYADTISTHSLRRGLATHAARAKASIKTIMNAGRWKQVNTVMEYIEASERFEDSAAASVLVTIKNNAS